MTADSKMPTALTKTTGSLVSTCDGAFVTRQQLINLLVAFLHGQVSAMDLQKWAAEIELSEQIEYEPTNAQLIADVIFELSSPEINGPLTFDRARNLSHLLE